MNNNLTFNRTIAGSLKSNVNVDAWNAVLDKFDAKQYADVVRGCINYVDPTIETRFANLDKTEYNIPHGSIIVHVKISNNELQVNAPFLSLEGAKQVPLLRQVAQLNFTPLVLSRIELEDDKLYFRLTVPLELCEPYKVYDIFREICINADNYDDEFITKFDAKRIQEPKVYPYDQPKKDAAWNAMQQYITEAFTVYEQLENKRLNGFLWDILSITLLKIDYYCSPQGSLRTEIEKAISNLNSNDEYYARLGAGKEALKKLQNYDRAKFERDLYKIDVFVPYKFRTNLESVRTNLKYAHETSDKEIKAMDYLGATFTIQYGILNFFYTNNVDDSIAEVLTQAMESASGKPVHDSAKILYEAVNKVMTTDNFVSAAAPTNTSQQTNQGEKKGFFSKFFG